MRVLRLGLLTPGASGLGFSASPLVHTTRPLSSWTATMFCCAPPCGQMTMTEAVVSKVSRCFFMVLTAFEYHLFPARRYSPKYQTPLPLPDRQIAQNCQSTRII